MKKKKKFRKGDIVKCVEISICGTSSNRLLTIGKLYTVTHVDKSLFIQIVADGDMHSFYSSRFVSDLKCVRSEKLKSIGLLSYGKV